MPIKIVPKNETAVQKRERIRQEQKKRAEQRKKQKMMTGGLDEANVKSPKKSPAAMKEQKRKADIRKKNKATLGSIFDRFIAGPKLKKKKKLGKVDVGLSEAMKKKRPTGMSPGALGGKLKSETKGRAPSKGKSFRDYKTIAAAKKAGSLYYMGKDGKRKAAVTKADLDKSGLSLRDYMNFMTGKTRKPTKKKMSYGGVSLKPKKKMK